MQASGVIGLGPRQAYKDSLLVDALNLPKKMFSINIPGKKVTFGSSDPAYLGFKKGMALFKIDHRLDKW